MNRAFQRVVAAPFFMREKGLLPPPFSILSDSEIPRGYPAGAHLLIRMARLVHPYERVHGLQVSTGSVRLKL
ncbi:hypothetical protein [Phocaeicola sartorii]|uniref:hypothetical protein n=1 Tax=Phocaeicola sartorii TaxID=671267 RepID=UPI000A53A897|nr:hypothetical protein [Phocaeicola sartorii]